MKNFLSFDDKQEFVAAMVGIMLISSIIVLLIDWKIKNDILTAARVLTDGRDHALLRGPGTVPDVEPGNAAGDPGMVPHQVLPLPDSVTGVDADNDVGTDP